MPNEKKLIRTRREHNISPIEIILRGVLSNKLLNYFPKALKRQLLNDKIVNAYKIAIKMDFNLSSILH